MSVIWITPLSIMISLLRAKRLPWTSISTVPSKVANPTSQLQFPAEIKLGVTEAHMLDFTMENDVPPGGLLKSINADIVGC